MKVRNVTLQAKSGYQVLKTCFESFFLKTKENNLENVRELNKYAQIRKRF